MLEVVKMRPGKNLKCKLAAGVLTISGTGEMTNFLYDAVSKEYVIPWYSFRNKIYSVRLQDGITSIGNDAFRECSKLKGIDIPASVTSIGKYAFWGCESMTAIRIPDGVVSIGDSAFFGCKKLTEVHISASVTSIARNAFALCTSLRKIEIPDGVSAICDNAFAICRSMTEIHIPASVTSIGQEAFTVCHALKDVYYYGSEAQWKNITIDGGNEYLIEATLHCEKAAPTASDSTYTGDKISFSAMVKQMVETSSTAVPAGDRTTFSAMVKQMIDNPSTAVPTEDKTTFNVLVEQMLAKSSNVAPAAAESYDPGGNPADSFAADHSVTPIQTAEKPSTASIPAPAPQPVPYSGDKPYIFFSYSHKNMEPALKLIRLLQNSGFRVWYDEGIDPGTEYRKVIARHVDACTFFISLISGDYLESEFCGDEIFLAKDMKKHQLLVYLDEIQLPIDWRLAFSRLQAIHYYTYTSDQAFLEKFMRTDGIDQCREGM